MNLALCETRAVNSPIISIIIPSREREDTLACCLRAMKHHISQDIEIVVIDSSRMGTAYDVVHQAAMRDSRIRYVAAPHSTSQRHSFEIGLAEARGDYLAIIGDDDGYVIGSIDWLAEKLRHVQVDAVRWNLMTYIWPSLSVDGEGFFEIYPGSCNGGTEIRPAEPMARRISLAQMPNSWSCLMVYHGMISRSVYERMKARTGGIFYRYPMQDIYTHNLLPFHCETYLQMDCIVSIYGMSASSANASWTCGIAEDKANPLEGHRWIHESLEDPVAIEQPWQPKVRTMSYHDYVVLKAAEASGFLGDTVIDDEAWIRSILQEIQDNPSQLENWFDLEPKAACDPRIMAEVRRKFSASVELPEKPTSILKPPRDNLPSMRIGVVDTSLPDDIEGAMLATRILLGDHDFFLAGVATSRLPSQHHRLSARHVMLFIRTHAPTLTKQIINSALMPRWLWRFIHRLFAGRSSDRVDAWELYGDMARKLTTGHGPKHANAQRQEVSSS